MSSDGAVPQESLMKRIFRRSSQTPSWEDGKVKASALPSILNQMGQQVDQTELNKMISQLDSSNSGSLDYAAYTKICERFVTDPARVEMGSVYQFAFPHLVNLQDFAHEAL